MIKIIRDDKKDKLEFPCLMETGLGTIMLITRGSGIYFTGTIVTPSNESDFAIGEYRSNWVELTPYKGSITLSNEG